VTLSTGSTGAAPAPQMSMTANKPRFKRLSPEELKAKHANGECYHCPEKYSADHKCITKGVLLIQLDDDMDEEDVAEDLGISLHALTSIDISDTMKLHIAINGSARGSGGLRLHTHVNLRGGGITDWPPSATTPGPLRQGRQWGPSHE
jgi:hypothetical protein